MVLVMAEAPLEAMGNVHKLMNQNAVLFISGHWVKLLGNDLYNIGGLKVHGGLPDASEAMDPSNNPSRLTLSTPDTVDVPRPYVVEEKEVDDLSYPFLYIGGVVVLDQA